MNERMNLEVEENRTMSSGMWRRVVWYIFSNVSEKTTRSASMLLWRCSRFGRNVSKLRSDNTESRLARRHYSVTAMTSWHLTRPTQTLRSKFHGDEVCTSQQIWNAFKTYGAPRLAACEELKVHTVHRGRHWKAITTVAPTGATGYWWRPDEDQWDAACRGVTCYGKLSVTDELHYPTDCSPC